MHPEPCTLHPEPYVTCTLWPASPPRRYVTSQKGAELKLTLNTTAANGNAEGHIVVQVGGSRGGRG